MKVRHLLQLLLVTLALPISPTVAHSDTQITIPLKKRQLSLLALSGETMSNIGKQVIATIGFQIVNVVDKKLHITESLTAQAALLTDKIMNGTSDAFSSFKRFGLTRDEIAKLIETEKLKKAPIESPRNGTGSVVDQFGGTVARLAVVANGILNPPTPSDKLPGLTKKGI